MYTRVKNSLYPGHSALGIFPPLSSRYELDDLAKDKVIEQAVVEISNRLTWYQENNKGNLSLYRCGNFPPMLPGLNLNFEQANKVIHHLNSELKLIGALHIPRINSILFQTIYGSFGLEYGSGGETGCYVLYHDFDEFDGFFPLKIVLPTQEEKYRHDVTQVLQEYFKKWEKNNKQGYIIPEHQNCILANYKKPESPYLKIGKYAASALVLGIFAYQIYNSIGNTSDDGHTYIPKL